MPVPELLKDTIVATWSLRASGRSLGDLAQTVLMVGPRPDTRWTMGMIPSKSATASLSQFPPFGFSDPRRAMC